MRITNNTIFLNLQRHLSVNSQALMQAQERVATQKRINRLSDDPIDGGRVLDLKATRERPLQYMSNIERASGLAGIQEQTLGDATDLIARAKELLLGEANEASSTATTREAARIEIAMLTSQMVQLGNTRYDSNYIFSGYATETPAFADAQVAAVAGAITGDATVTGAQINDVTKLTYDDYQIQFTGPATFDVVNTTDGQTVLSGQSYLSGQPIRFDGVELTLTDGALGPAAGDVYDVSLTAPGVYQGDGKVQYIAIQEGQKVSQNIPGDRVFQGAGLAGGEDVFDIFNQIQQALDNNDRDAMDQLLGRLDTVRTQISNERSQVGARMNQLDQVKERHSEIEMQLDELRSNLEDVDLTEAITDLNKQQNAYEATIGSAAQIIQPSLLDFLR